MTLDPAIERRLRGVLEASPGLSDAAIAREAGVSRNSVRRMRAALVAAGLLPQSIARQGADGRIRVLPGRKGRVLVDGQPVLSASEREDCLSVVKAAAKGGSVRAALWLLERDQTGAAPEPNVPPDDDEMVPEQARRAELRARLQRRKEQGRRLRPRQGESA